MSVVRDVRVLIVASFVGVVVLLLSSLLTVGLAAAADGGKQLEPPTADPSNDRLGVTLGADGRFSAGAFPDASGAPTTGSYTLLYGWPSTGTSYTTLRVDDADVVYGSAAGTFTQSPNGGGSADDVSAWRSGDLSVTQTVGLAANPLTGRNDTAKITYKVTNTGTAAHRVGSRVMLDTDVNSNDGAPFRVPGTGSVTTEKDFSGAAVPNNFTVFQNLADATHIAGAVLSGAAATPPDRLVIGQWRGLHDSPWDYTTTPDAPITGDSAYAAYWTPAALAAGQSRTYTTYYGLGDVTVDLTPPVALGVDGPTALSASGAGYTPNPFVVTATLSNETATPASDVRATLNLPAGLTAREATTRVVGDLPVGSGERIVSWTVTAAPQTRATTLDYSVTATTTGVAPKTVRRSLAVPASVSTPTRKNIVSLGDSYSSGEGAQAPVTNPADRVVTYDRGTNTGRNTCHRASTAWPRLLGVPADRHFACSGATSLNLIESGGNDDARTSQISRLREVERSLARSGQHVDVVTLTMGGNDLGFGPLLQSCFYIRSCLNGIGQDQRYFSGLTARYSWVVNGIRQAAPRAKILLVGYPRLFPSANPVNCGWLTTEERIRANTFASEFNRAMAKTSGVTYIPVLNAVDGHELCTPDSYIVPLGQPNTRILTSEQGHPRSRGQEKIADIVRPYLS